MLCGHHAIHDRLVLKIEAVREGQDVRNRHDRDRIFREEQRPGAHQGETLAECLEQTAGIDLRHVAEMTLNVAACGGIAQGLHGRDEAAALVVDDHPVPQLGCFAQSRRRDLFDGIAGRLERASCLLDGCTDLGHHVIERGRRDGGAQRPRRRGTGERRRHPIGIARIAPRHGSEGEAQVCD